MTSVRASSRSRFLRLCPIVLVVAAVLEAAPSSARVDPVTCANAVVASSGPQLGMYSATSGVGTLGDFTVVGNTASCASGTSAVDTRWINPGSDLALLNFGPWPCKIGSRLPVNAAYARGLGVQAPERMTCVVFDNTGNTGYVSRWFPIDPNARGQIEGSLKLGAKLFHARYHTVL